MKEFIALAVIAGTLALGSVAVAQTVRPAGAIEQPVPPGMTPMPGLTPMPAPTNLPTTVPSSPLPTIAPLPSPS